MRSVKNTLSILVALAAILSASLWSSAGSACLFDATPNVVGGSSMTMPPHHMAHKSIHPAAITHKAPTSAPAPGSPGGPRLDCAACMAVLPNFPSMAPHELMPFVPQAQTFEPLFGIDPALDPPPPRPSKP